VAPCSCGAEVAPLLVQSRESPFDWPGEYRGLLHLRQSRNGDLDPGDGRRSTARCISKSRVWSMEDSTSKTRLDRSMLTFTIRLIQESDDHLLTCIQPMKQVSTRQPVRGVRLSKSLPCERARTHFHSSRPRKCDHATTKHSHKEARELVTAR
jgi:hypothetical protein